MAYKKTAEKLSKKLQTILGDPSIVISPDKVALFNAISRGSQTATAIVVPYVNSIVKSIGLKSSAAVTETDCKRMIRAFAKAVSRFEGDIEQVPDIGRMRILIEKPEDIIALRELCLGKSPRYTNKRIGVLRPIIPKGDITDATGIRIREFEDYYHVPSSTGRIGIHIGLDVTVPGLSEPVQFEIQVLHKDMLEVEDLTRANYEQVQLIERRAIAEGRVNEAGKAILNEEESATVHTLNERSKELYRAGALDHDLYRLRRPDLAAKEGYRRREMMPKAA